MRDNNSTTKCPLSSPSHFVKGIDELNNLVNLRHPNITYIYDAFECNNTFYLIIERCLYSFENVIKRPKDTRDILLPYIARDILQALNFIHRYSGGYVHKDIHPGNVFVFMVEDRIVPDKEPIYTFKIGDLGISRLARDIDFNTTLAQWMLPPEYLNPQEFGILGKQTDIYHTGLLLLSLLIGKIPTLLARFPHLNVKKYVRVNHVKWQNNFLQYIVQLLQKHYVGMLNIEPTQDSNFGMTYQMHRKNKSTPLHETLSLKTGAIRTKPTFVG